MRQFTDLSKSLNFLEERKETFLIHNSFEKREIFLSYKDANLKIYCKAAKKEILIALDQIQRMTYGEQTVWKSNDFY
jgi:hypothetical protein